MPRGSRSSDRECLLALYWSSAGPRWRKKAGWEEGTADLSNWHGILCNQQGRVVRLNLSHNGLEGTIPAAVGYLEELEVLRLDSNKLTGPIPPTLGNLSDLSYLDLRLNQLSGHLPPELGKLKEVSKIDCSCNLLSGKIPREWEGMTNLMLLWLEKNHIEGPIPPELANIPQLIDLDLADNRVPERRLQGGELQAWKESARRKGSVSSDPMAILSSMLAKEKEIEALKGEIMVWKAENEQLKSERTATSSTEKVGRSRKGSSGFLAKIGI